MRLFIILRYIGLVMLFNAVFMFISFLIAWYHHDTSQMPLLYSTVVVSLMGVFPIVFVPPTYDLNQKEGYSIVVFSWLLSCLIGIFPYVMWGGEFSVTNAWFESVSGYTTTGSTVLKNVEALPKGLLFWRASTHWVGGVGIVLFVLVILPAVFKVKTSLYKLEMSSLAMDNFRYRTNKVLNIILFVYLGLTFVQTLLLWIAGMGLFDAVCHSFATVATGGFSTKNLSVAHYNSLSIEVIIMIFMVISGMHFGLLFTAFTGDVRTMFKSEVVRYYILSLSIGILIVAFSIYGIHYQTFGESLRYASFQVLSCATSTGFATAGSEVWPPLAILIIIFFTFQTACAGSTSGGIKVDRMLIFFKGIKKQFLRMMHPNAILSFKLDTVSIRDEAMENTVTFIVFYVLIVFLSSVAISAMGVDMLSSFSGAAACMGNVGPGFGVVSSLGNFSTIPDAGKWILSLDMLIGRLEIFGLMMIFLLRSWK